MAPKCTHAYVVSRSGAARIVRHLRSTISEFPGFKKDGQEGTPPVKAAANSDQPYSHDNNEGAARRGPSFAYGRALDQALVRLIQGRRISAFSIVPSVVTQTKEGPSDIALGGNGSAWRDMLEDSALTRLRGGGDPTTVYVTANRAYK